MLGNNLYLMVQMLDIETARAVYSSRLILAAWEEYDRKVRGFSDEFMRKLPEENILTGAWSGHYPRRDHRQLHRRKPLRR